MLEQRFDRDGDDLHPAVFALHRHPGAQHRAAGLHRLAKQRAQVEPQSLPRHGQQLAVGQPRRSLQVFSGAGREIHHVAVAVHHDVWRGEAVQHLAMHRLPQREPARHGPARPAAARGRGPQIPHDQRQAHAGGHVVQPAEDAMLLVQRGKQLAELRRVLRRAEEQVARFPQRVMKSGDDLPLRGAIQVDQQVAAGHQVHAGQRRVADHAMGGEDAQVAHVPGHEVAAALGQEEAGAARGG